MPYVMSGNPRYAYVDFSTPEAAQVALTLHNSYIKGTKIQIKLKPTSSSQSSPVCSGSISQPAATPQTKTSAKSLTETSTSTQPTSIPCSAIKVSFLGNSTPSAEDILDAFSSAGKIILKPLVLPGNPHYAYVDFSSPQEAQAAVKLNVLSIKGCKVHVRLKSGCNQFVKVDQVYPPEWEPQVKDIQLFPMSVDSAEWSEVNRLLHKTMPNATIVFLDRIQNKWLWDKYRFSLERLEKKTKGETNERLLFHGTSLTSPSKVYTSEHGFDFRYAADGLWGSGIYFAENASYSNEYSYPFFDDLKQFLVAKVLTGVSYNFDSNTCGGLRKPPTMSSTAPDIADELYDSVSGWTGGSNIYVKLR